MLTKAELSEIIVRELEPMELQMYDLEFFPSKSAVLLVFINQSSGGSPTITECVRATKAIRNAPELEMFVQKFSVEVSSPGINRKLRTPEHLVGAVGERVKMVLKFGPHQGNTLVGNLKSFEEGKGVLELRPNEKAQAGTDEAGKGEAGKELVNFEYSDIKSAKINAEIKF